MTKDIVVSDVDEVLGEWLDGFLNFYNMLRGTLWKKSAMHSYEWSKVIGGTTPELKQLAIDYAFAGGIEGTLPVQGAREGVYEISRKRDVIAVTARPESWRERTDPWIRRTAPEVSRAIYTGAFFGAKTTKGDVCIETGAKVIIEDQFAYAAECAARGIHALLLDKPWNQGEVPSNVTRVYSWAEIPSKIDDILR